MKAFEFTDIQLYNIEGDLYTLKVFEGKQNFIYQVVKKDRVGKFTKWNSKGPLKNVLRSIISAYEIPSIADRTYVMEGSMFCIRLTENDVIVDVKYNWNEGVDCLRFFNEDIALLWVLNHFRV